MDPNAVLRDILAITTPIVEARSPLFSDPNSGDDPALVELADLADKVHALHEWISEGGFLPTLWSVPGPAERKATRDSLVRLEQELDGP